MRFRCNKGIYGIGLVCPAIFQKQRIGFEGFSGFDFSGFDGLGAGRASSL